MSKQRALANQEREAQVERLGKWGRAMSLSCATLLSFAAIALLAADNLYRPDAFVVDQLKIKGKFRYVDPVNVEAVVRGHGLGNFFSIELDAIQQKVGKMPWVYRAEVRREWPNTLLIQLSEQRPIMRWGSDKWVNTAGQVIDLPGEVFLPDAIQLKGNADDAPKILQQALTWKQRLQASDLALKAVALSDSNAWTLTLYSPLQSSEFEVLLGREQVAERLARFETLYRQQFSDASRRLERVDARYPDGLAIRASKASLNEAVAVQ